MDTEHYLSDLRMSVLEQNNVWQGVAQKFGAAYAAAYTQQQKDLNDIKAAIEADQKRTQAVMSMVLGLLTGGIVGPLADKLAGKVFTYERATDLANAAKFITADEVLTGWAKNAFTELAKAGDERVRGLTVDAVSGAAPDTGFDPATLSPTEYADRIKLGMSKRAVVMSDLARLMYDNLQWLPVPVAKSVNAAFKSSDYFSPVSRDLFALDDKVLIRSACVMLWIAWGKVRDTKYWNRQLEFPGEIGDWAPLLKILQDLGIPTVKFDFQISTYRPYRAGGGTISYATFKTINMPKFIEWSKGSTAASVAFTGLPTDEAGRKVAELQLTMANTRYGQ